MENIIQKLFGGITRNKVFKDNRRLFERIPSDLSLRFFNAQTNKWRLVKTRDISIQGIGLVTEEDLPDDTLLEMWLPIPDKGESLYTRGNVVWSKMIEPNRYRVGVNLEKADLVEICRILRTKYFQTF